MELAPIVPHARPSSKDELLCTSRLQPLPLSTLVVLLIAHSTHIGLTVRWKPGYATDDGLSGDHEFPMIGASSSGDSMARLLRLVVGTRSGLCIVLLSCGLSEAEIDSLVGVCLERKCHLVLSTARDVPYANMMDPTLSEFTRLALGYMQVAHLLRGRSQMTGCPFAIPTEAAFAMAQTALGNTSLTYASSPPLFISACGVKRYVTGAASSGLVPLASSAPAAMPSLLAGSCKTDLAATEHIEMQVDEATMVSSLPSSASSIPGTSGKILKERFSSKRHGGGRRPKQHVSQLRAVEMGSSELIATLPSVAKKQVAANIMLAYTAEVVGLVGRRTLLFTCQGMGGGDHDSYRKRTVNLGRDLKRQSSDMKRLSVSSADVEQLVQLYCLSSRFNAPLVHRSHQVFVL